MGNRTAGKRPAREIEMSNIIASIREAASDADFWGNGDDARSVVRHAVTREGHETVIVSRHAGAVEWLAAQGVAGTVIEQATAEDVRGKVVVGNLPLHLAAEAHQVGSIDLPGLTREQRGRDLTPAEMDAAGAVIRWYIVAAV